MFRLCPPPPVALYSGSFYFCLNKSNRSSSRQRKILFPLLPLSTIVSAFWNFLSVLLPIIWYWGWGHCPPGAQCGFSLLVQHLGLPGSHSSLPDLSLSVLLLLLKSPGRVRLWTTLKENLGSACTHIWATPGISVFVCLEITQRVVQTWVNWCPAPYWSGIIWGSYRICT